MKKAPKGKKVYIWTVLIPWQQHVADGGNEAISRFRMTDTRKIEQRQARRILRSHIEKTIGATPDKAFLNDCLRKGLKGWF